MKLRKLADVARKLTNGQLAAARYAQARRGELGLSQRELAKRAHVSERAIQNFETGRTWPNTDTLARLERMGLDLVVGHLAEYAARHNEAELEAGDELIAAVLASNLHPDLKLRLVDRLRGIVADKSIEALHNQAQAAEQLVAELNGSPGEGKEKGREIA